MAGPARCWGAAGDVQDAWNCGFPQVFWNCGDDITSREEKEERFSGTISPTVSPFFSFFQLLVPFSFLHVFVVFVIVFVLFY